MSSVLKALKKLDQEKRGGDVPISMINQRWASGGQPERKSRLWLLAGSGLAVVLLLALLLLWPARKPATVVTVSVDAPTPKAVTTLPVEPEVPVVVATTGIEKAPPAAVSPLPVPAPQPVTQPAPQVKTPRSVPPLPVPAPVSVVPAPPAIVTSPPQPPVVRSVAEEPVEIPVKQTQVSRFDIPAAGQEWVAPPQLNVSEIFPATGGERMAIVNGLPVMTGTMVDEALVEEIHDDRLVFAIGGKRVTVPLQKSR